MKAGRLISRLRAAAGILHGRRQFGGPVLGSISLTTRCNIRCIHCYYHSPLVHTPSFPAVRKARLRAEEPPSDEAVKRYTKIDLDPSAARKVIERLIHSGTRRFQLSGFGEPFLYPEIMDCIDRVKRSGSFCLSNSNGTAFNKEIVDQLVTTGFDLLRVTTMAGTAADYIQTHPGSNERTFDRLKSSLRHLAEAKAARNQKSPRLDLVCIVISPNVHRLWEFVMLAEEVHADSITFRPFNDVGDPGLAALVPSADEADFLRKELAEIRQRLAMKGIPNNIEKFLMAFAGRLDTAALYRSIPCYQGWISTYISPLGDVTPCCGCSTPLGNIQDQDILSIWDSAQYNRFRREALGLPQRAVFPEDCDCAHCVHHTLNTRVFRALHPWRGRDEKLKPCPPIAKSPRAQQ